MTNTTHQWTMFQKGRLRIKACACCGEMSLPSNSQSVCDERNILTSPIVRAGYTLVVEMPKIGHAPQRVA